MGFKHLRAATVATALLSFSLNATPVLAAGVDFATRCADPAVVRCIGFDAPADFNTAGNRPGGALGENFGIVPPNGTTDFSKATRDTSVKASGDSSLKFTIPSNGGPDSSGAFFANFSQDLGVTFGSKNTFFVQWRQRFSPEFINTRFLNDVGGDANGWKQIILGTGDSSGKPPAGSCTPLDLMVQNYGNAGFPVMSHSCTGSTSHGPNEAFYTPFGVHDFKLQNIRPSPFCLQSQAPNHYFKPDGNCFGYVPNEWITFQMRIQVGPRVGNEFVDSYITLWAGRDGKSSQQLLNWGPYKLSAGPAREGQRFGKIWLLPFNTNKSAGQAHPTAYTWYDELIISKKKIADPTPASAAPSCDQTLSAGANLLSAITSAAAGATLCLGNGNYGGFTLNNVSKSPRVTVRAVNAGSANLTTQINIAGSTQGVTFDGINYNGISITGTAAANLTFRNGDASKATIQIDGVRTATPNILFENLTHNNQDNSGACHAGTVNCIGSAGYWFSFDGRATPVATIRGATISGGCADGIQSGVPFILEGSTIRNKQVGACINDPHTDATQLYGGPFAGTIIRGNYYYRNVQVLAAYDGVDKILVENNVFDPGPDGERRPCQIELYSDDSSIVRHNTIVYRGASLGHICLDRKSADNAGFGTVIVDNIATSIEIANGSTFAQRSNNLVRAGAGGSDITGAPIFVGGAIPTTYAGFELATGSPGKGAGSTPPGSDIGIMKPE